MHTVDASETIGRMVEFFPSIKQPLIRSILAGVLRGVISQRLLPRVGGGRVPAVEVMVGNARIADLIRENKSGEIIDAIAEGKFFQMQTFSDALIRLVVDGKVDREVAANAASNRHDFLIALERALKEQALAALPELQVEAEPEPEGPEAAADEAQESPSGDEQEPQQSDSGTLPRLRVAGQK
jgi:twitching motility protein PilT